MDTDTLFIAHITYTIERAYRDTGYTVCFDVHSMVQALYDKALLDDDSQESLLFNGVHIACDEYIVCSQFAKRQYAKRVVSAVSKCRDYMHGQKS